MTAGTFKILFTSQKIVQSLQNMTQGLITTRKKLEFSLTTHARIYYILEIQSEDACLVVCAMEFSHNLKVCTQVKV